jgi:hypothetical protein
MNYQMGRSTAPGHRAGMISKETRLRKAAP